MAKIINLNQKRKVKNDLAKEKKQLKIELNLVEQKMKER